MFPGLVLEFYGTWSGVGGRMRSFVWHAWKMRLNKSLFVDKPIK